MCSLPFFNCRKYIIFQLSDWREDGEEFSNIWAEAKVHADRLGIELKPPRMCKQTAKGQVYRPNPDYASAEEYFRQVVFDAFVDHLIAVSSFQLCP
jgi:hypothetical protein